MKSKCKEEEINRQYNLLLNSKELNRFVLYKSIELIMGILESSISHSEGSSNQIYQKLEEKFPGIFSDENVKIKQLAIIVILIFQIYLDKLKHQKEPTSEIYESLRLQERYFFNTEFITLDELCILKQTLIEYKSNIQNKYEPLLKKAINILLSLTKKHRSMLDESFTIKIASVWGGLEQSGLLIEENDATMQNADKLFQKL